MHALTLYTSGRGEPYSAIPGDEFSAPVRQPTGSSPEKQKKGAHQDSQVLAEADATDIFLI